MGVLGPLILCYCMNVLEKKFKNETKPFGLNKNTKTKNLQEVNKIKTKHKGQRVGNLTKGTKQTTDINRLGQTKIRETKQRRSNKKLEGTKGPSFSISQNKESNKNTQKQKPVKRKVVTKRQHSFSIKEKGDKA